jgi:hypothetical protein
MRVVKLDAFLQAEVKIRFADRKRFGSPDFLDNMALSMAWADAS